MGVRREKGASAEIEQNEGTVQGLIINKDQKEAQGPQDWRIEYLEMKKRGMRQGGTVGGAVGRNHPCGTRSVSGEHMRGLMPCPQLLSCGLPGLPVSPPHGLDYCSFPRDLLFFCSQIRLPCSASQWL